MHRSQVKIIAWVQETRGLQPTSSKSESDVKILTSQAWHADTKLQAALRCTLLARVQALLKTINRLGRPDRI